MKERFSRLTTTALSLFVLVHYVWVLHS